MWDLGGKYILTNKEVYNIDMISNFFTDEA
jgi:hypothetical protein